MSAVAVFGATGHTGRFVVDALARRGLSPIAVGRDKARLQALHGSGARVASIEDPASLDRAFEGVGAVINCAGPFLDTAAPVIAAALRAGIHYLDVTAEQAAAADAFGFDRQAKAAGATLLPAMAFYGGLADLLATAAMGEWTSADAIEVAVALDSWRPTPGTRRTGERNHFPRQVVSGGRLRLLADPPPRRVWDFAPPFGPQEVVGLPLAETITISRHLAAPEVHSFMNLAPLADLRDPKTPPPVAADASGRSDQMFLIEVVAQDGGERRRASAQGRDIYAITAPLIAEAARRLLDGEARPGAFAAGELFEPQGFLAALAADGLAFGLRSEPG